MVSSTQANSAVTQGLTVRDRTWILTLDRLGLALLLFDGQGSERYRTTALDTILARAPVSKSEQVLVAAKRIAQEQCRASSAQDPGGLITPRALPGTTTRL